MEVRRVQELYAVLFVVIVSTLVKDTKALGKVTYDCKSKDGRWNVRDCEYTFLGDKIDKSSFSGGCCYKVDNSGTIIAMKCPFGGFGGGCQPLWTFERVELSALNWDPASQPPDNGSSGDGRGTLRTVGGSIAGAAILIALISLSYRYCTCCCKKPTNPASTPQQRTANSAV